MLTVQLIGFGAIGAALYSALAAQPQVRVDAVVVHPGRIEALRTVNPEVPFTSALLLDKRPDWVVECAGHSAIEQHVLAALQQGIRCLVVSVGALASGDLLERVRAAAQAGHTQAHLLPGAVGGLDALGAARAAGLTRVRYCGRKPPLAWRGTAAEVQTDLALVKSPTQLFQGSARAAAQQFPKNANVAATVALAGMGLDATEVELWADPSVTDNVHEIHVEGVAGRMDICLQNQPLAANPKTSALTFFSLLHALHQRGQSIVI